MTRHPMKYRTEKNMRALLQRPPRFNDPDQVAAVEFLERVDACVSIIAGCPFISFHQWKTHPNDWTCDCIKLIDADVAVAALNRLGHAQRWE